ncbi:hypothetical protein Ahy_B10g104597 isoform A [Arachis hypogaea]|uniref:Uncharacterized protein n=1 Tax=Arachis hypogaea TaxID=3818 RepID=A0A444X5X8_ARAHY|nr:hypothetical protein Ahy_B10g104597 isoform A [Arachis hypogaea]
MSPSQLLNPTAKVPLAETMVSPLVRDRAPSGFRFLAYLALTELHCNVHEIVNKQLSDRGENSEELDKLRKRFELTEAENVYLNKSIERIDKELHEATGTSFHLSHQIENSKSG